MNFIVLGYKYYDEMSSRCLEDFLRTNYLVAINIVPYTWIIQTSYNASELLSEIEENFPELQAFSGTIDSNIEVTYKLGSNLGLKTWF